jgi:hypothetical protein
MSRFEKGRHIHLCLDIRGAIHNRDGWKSVSAKDGRKLTKAEAVEWLMDRLAEGKRVLPFGECEGFSYQTGCPGHEDSDSAGQEGPSSGRDGKEPESPSREPEGRGTP